MLTADLCLEFSRIRGRRGTLKRDGDEWARGSRMAMGHDQQAAP